jgi:hypothetical protein
VMLKTLQWSLPGKTLHQHSMNHQRSNGYQALNAGMDNVRLADIDITIRSEANR